jgi:type II secretory pathway pseudopilin PulG
MPIGSLNMHANRPGLGLVHHHRSGPLERGFTYLLLLFVLALGSAALAALAEQWITLDQREREAELLFRGAQFQEALASYALATPPGGVQAPSGLDELLVDARNDPPRHHLRRLYTDPFTKQADWLLLLNATGQITGVTSRSRQAALRRVDLPLQPEADPRAPAVGDWRFEVEQAHSGNTGTNANSAVGKPKPPGP